MCVCNQMISLAKKKSQFSLFEDGFRHEITKFYKTASPNNQQFPQSSRIQNQLTKKQCFSEYQYQAH